MSGLFQQRQDIGFVCMENGNVPHSGDRLDSLVMTGAKHQHMIQFSRQHSGMSMAMFRLPIEVSLVKKFYKGRLIPGDL